jgi:hypothetical protein
VSEAHDIGERSEQGTPAVDQSGDGDGDSAIDVETDADPVFGLARHPSSDDGDGLAVTCGDLVGADIHAQVEVRRVLRETQLAHLPVSLEDHLTGRAGDPASAGEGRLRPGDCPCGRECQEQHYNGGESCGATPVGRSNALLERLWCLV